MRYNESPPFRVQLSRYVACFAAARVLVLGMRFVSRMNCGSADGSLLVVYIFRRLLAINLTPIRVRVFSADMQTDIRGSISLLGPRSKSNIVGRAWSDDWVALFVRLRNIQSFRGEGGGYSAQSALNVVDFHFCAKIFSCCCYLHFHDQRMG